MINENRISFANDLFRCVCLNTVRIHRPKETFCYYVGYVRNQKIKYISKLDGECKGGPPNKGSWFQMSLSLRDGIAMIDLDGKHLVTSSPHFETRARGGDPISLSRFSPSYFSRQCS